MDESIKRAATDSLVKDAAALYARSREFREAYDRAVLDHLTLRRRIVAIALMHAQATLMRDRGVMWSPGELIDEIVRRRALHA